ncbi:hypothetical protein SLAVM298S_01298 [Streptomyces lavendulae subsp. lavendulae]
MEGAAGGAASVREPSPSHSSGSTAKIPSSSGTTPSSRASRSSSNHSAGAIRSPYARAHSRQVWISAPTSMLTAWKEKLLYLKEFCQYLTPSTRYWVQPSGPAPSAARTSPVTSPVSSRRSPCWCGA